MLVNRTALLCPHCNGVVRDRDAAKADDDFWRSLWKENAAKADIRELPGEPLAAASLATAKIPSDPFSSDSDPFDDVFYFDSDGHIHHK